MADVSLLQDRHGDGTEGTRSHVGGSGCLSTESKALRVPEETLFPRGLNDPSGPRGSFTRGNSVGEEEEEPEQNCRCTGAPRTASHPTNPCAVPNGHSHFAGCSCGSDFLWQDTDHLATGSNKGTASSQAVPAQGLPLMEGTPAMLW